ncbi:MAG: hypothetical protein EOO77_36605 [Oxalobacteraceae bacterium]|nr:MAG: hypothetical protein EOO77_36605 [Oxalobacteraceae bacterium]
MDTFEQMLNEDIASFLKGVASSAKDRTKHALKQFGNDMLADLGSHSAAGRYDLAATAREVMDEWKYFAAQQQARPTVSGVVEFFRTSIGITMDEDQAFRAIYGTAAETVNKPPRPADDKQKTIANAFRKLVNPKTLDAKVLVDELHWREGTTDPQASVDEALARLRSWRTALEGADAATLHRYRENPPQAADGRTGWARDQCCTGGRRGGGWWCEGAGQHRTASAAQRA